jgi:hypothetical protein
MTAGSSGAARRTGFEAISVEQVASPQCQARLTDRHPLRPARQHVRAGLTRPPPRGGSCERSSTATCRSTPSAPLSMSKRDVARLAEARRGGWAVNDGETSLEEIGLAAPSATTATSSSPPYCSPPRAFAYRACCSPITAEPGARPPTRSPRGSADGRRSASRLRGPEYGSPGHDPAQRLWIFWIYAGWARTSLHGAIAAARSRGITRRSGSAEDEHEVLEGVIPARRVVAG